MTPTQFVEELVAGPFDAPTNSSLLPDGRLFVVEQYTAQVRLIVDGQMSAIDPAGVVPGIRTGGEAGLLGVADGPDAAASHNGGALRFGPDGHLYSGIGDDENPCRAQSVNRLNGRILRLDVSQLPPGGGGPPPYAAITPADNPFVAHPDSAARLVWAMGLRNPFSFTIDAATGCLFIGDVGSQSWEEIDVACAGGMNFGWPHYEGNHRLVTINCSAIDTTRFVPPVHEYPHVGAGWAVFAGPLYHAPAGRLVRL